MARVKIVESGEALSAESQQPSTRGPGAEEFWSFGLRSKSKCIAGASGAVSSRSVPPPFRASNFPAVRVRMRLIVPAKVNRVSVSCANSYTQMSIRFRRSLPGKTLTVG